jgi:hypothetical protein
VGGGFLGGSRDIHLGVALASVHISKWKIGGVRKEEDESWRFDFPYLNANKRCTALLS